VLVATHLHAQRLSSHKKGLPGDRGRKRPRPRGLKRRGLPAWIL